MAALGARLSSGGWNSSSSRSKLRIAPDPLRERLAEERRQRKQRHRVVEEAIREVHEMYEKKSRHVTEDFQRALEKREELLKRLKQIEVEERIDEVRHEKPPPLFVRGRPNVETYLSNDLLVEFQRELRSSIAERVEKQFDQLSIHLDDEAAERLLAFTSISEQDFIARGRDLFREKVSEFFQRKREREEKMVDSSVSHLLSSLERMVTDSRDSVFEHSVRVRLEREKFLRDLKIYQIREIVEATGLKEDVIESFVSAPCDDCTLDLEEVLADTFLDSHINQPSETKLTALLEEGLQVLDPHAMLDSLRREFSDLAAEEALLKQEKEKLQGELENVRSLHEQAKFDVQQTRTEHAYRVLSRLPAGASFSIAVEELPYSLRVDLEKASRLESEITNLQNENVRKRTLLSSVKEQISLIRDRCDRMHSADHSLVEGTARIYMEIEDTQRRCADLYQSLLTLRHRSKEKHELSLIKDEIDALNAVRVPDILRAESDLESLRITARYVPDILDAQLGELSSKSESQKLEIVKLHRPQVENFEASLRNMSKLRNKVENELEMRVYDLACLQAAMDPMDSNINPLEYESRRDELIDDLRDFVEDGAIRLLDRQRRGQFGNERLMSLTPYLERLNLILSMTEDDMVFRVTELSNRGKDIFIRLRRLQTEFQYLQGFLEKDPVAE